MIPTGKALRPLLGLGMGCLLAEERICGVLMSEGAYFKFVEKEIFK